MVTWVLERGVFADGDDGLATAALAVGDRVVDWQDDWWHDGRWPADLQGPVVFHGSLSNAATARPW